MDAVGAQTHALAIGVVFAGWIEDGHHPES